MSVRCGLTIATGLALLPSRGAHCPSAIASMWMLVESTINDAYLPWKHTVWDIPDSHEPINHGRLVLFHKIVP